MMKQCVGSSVANLILLQWCGVRAQSRCGGGVDLQDWPVEEPSGQYWYLYSKIKQIDNFHRGQFKQLAIYRKHFHSHNFLVFALCIEDVTLNFMINTTESGLL